MNLTGQQLGKYKLIERLGQGAMAQVYKAHQPTIDRFVAIKVMHGHLAESADFVARFKREARGLGQLSHPHIVNVIDFDAAGEQYFMVMDYIAGPTLDAYLRRRGALPLPEALAIAAQLASALAYAHEREIIHRDLKPGNVMFLDETAAHAVLTDFGLVRLLDDVGMTMSGTITGTPAYMSPEAARGEHVDGRSDIYSLGVILYQMVTGDTPYKGESPLSMMMQHLNDPLPPLRETHPTLPEPLIQLVERALEKEAAHRFQTASELFQAIRRTQQALDHGGVIPTMLQTQDLNGSPATHTAVLSSPPPAAPADNGRRSDQSAKPTRQPKTEPKRPRRWLWPGIGLLLLLLAAGGAWQFGLFPDDAGDATPEAIAAVVDDGRLGTLQFIDEGDNGESISLLVEQATAPPAGSHYAGWIQTGDGRLVPLGKLPFADGQLQTSLSLAEDSTLLPHFGTVFITLETDGPDGSSPATPSEQVAFRGSLPPAYTDALRQLFLASRVSSGQGLIPGAVEQTGLAIQHNDMLIAALNDGNLAEAKLHAEHIINILDGEDGEFFGDLDGDGQAQNPGDGVGVRTYLTEASAQIETAASLLPATPERQEAAAQALTANDLAQDRLQTAVDTASRLLAADTATEAQDKGLQIAIPLVELLNGSDLDGSGAIEVNRSEGGLLAAAERVSALSQVSLHADTAQSALNP